MPKYQPDQRDLDILSLFLWRPGIPITIHRVFEELKLKKIQMDENEFIERLIVLRENWFLVSNEEPEDAREFILNAWKNHENLYKLTATETSYFLLDPQYSHWMRTQIGNQKKKGIESDLGK